MEMFLKPRLHDQSFPSKTLSKFFDHVNLHQKLWSKTLTDFDGIELHPIFLKTLMDFDGI